MRLVDWLFHRVVRGSEFKPGELVFVNRYPDPDWYLIIGECHWRWSADSSGWTYRGTALKVQGATLHVATYGSFAQELLHQIPGIEYANVEQIPREQSMLG